MHHFILAWICVLVTVNAPGRKAAVVQGLLVLALPICVEMYHVIADHKIVDNLSYLSALCWS